MEVNPKYQAIMASAREIFWKYGVKRVSVEEICKHAGVSKMTFYKFFPNKLELAKQLYKTTVDDALDQFRQMMKSNISPDEKIRKMIEMKSEGVHGISQEFIQDLYQNPELGLKDFVEKISAKSWMEIVECFREAQNEGVLRKDVRPEFLYYYSHKITEMLTDKGLLKLYDSPEEAIRELITFFAYGVSHPK
jgi:AcrR family transcriptional regulator